jgi:hypothetical protein
MPKMNAAPMLTNPAQGGTMFGKRHKTAQEHAACAHQLPFRYSTLMCACAGQASHEKTQAQDCPVQQVCFGAGTLCRTAVNLRGLFPREALFFLHPSVFFAFCFNQVNRSKPKQQRNNQNKTFWVEDGRKQLRPTCCWCDSNETNDSANAGTRSPHLVSPQDILQQTQQEATADARRKCMDMTGSTMLRSSICIPTSLENAP